MASGGGSGSTIFVRIFLHRKEYRLSQLTKNQYRKKHHAPTTWHIPTANDIATHDVSQTAHSRRDTPDPSTPKTTNELYCSTSDAVR